MKSEYQRRIEQLMQTALAGADPQSMSVDQYVTYMNNVVSAFRETVRTHPDYQFVRDGQNMPLGDWFEQMAVQAGLM